MIRASELVSQLANIFPALRPSSESEPSTGPGPATAAAPAAPSDRAEISSAARAAATNSAAAANSIASPTPPSAAFTSDPLGTANSLSSPQLLGSGASATDPVDSADEGSEAASTSSTPGSKELSSDEQQEVRELSQRDREVRSHEQAHKAAAGSYAGSISYTYTTGPDGKRYASGGSVPIDSSPIEGDPQATIRKMQQVQAAANAPANPSSADRQVAAKAARELQKAQQQSLEERSGNAGAEDEAPSSTPRLDVLA